MNSRLQRLLNKTRMFFFKEKNITVTDLLEELELYEEGSPEWIDEEDAIHIQAIKDAITFKCLTGG